jgi:hypothetical protein
VDGTDVYRLAGRPDRTHTGAPVTPPITVAPGLAPRRAAASDAAAAPHAATATASDAAAAPHAAVRQDAD